MIVKTHVDRENILTIKNKAIGLYADKVTAYEKYNIVFMVMTYRI